VLYTYRIYLPYSLQNIQYPKIPANACIQCAWAIRTEQPGCSLHLRLFHTGQTAVASIAFCPKAVGTAWFVTVLVLAMFTLPSRRTFAGLLPVSSLAGSRLGLARPASHQNRSAVLEHSPGIDGSMMSLYLFSQCHRKAERQNSAMDVSKCECLAAFFRKDYNTMLFAEQAYYRFC
jgi:hypothetical protein